MLRIAVVGVSSLIGEAVIDELRARKMPIAELHALDDERNVGRPVSAEEGAQSSALPVSDVAAFDFSRVDLAFFCGRTALSERYAEAAAAHAWVIDGSAAFRARADVPLVAADVNPRHARRGGHARSDCAAGQRQRGARHRACAPACRGWPHARRGCDLSGGIG